MAPCLFTKNNSQANEARCFAMCYVICVMSYVVQDSYDSYMSYVVQRVLNALIIPYMVILMCYVIC